MKLSHSRRRLIYTGIMVLGMVVVVGLTTRNSTAAVNVREMNAAGRACAGSTGAQYSLLQVGDGSSTNPLVSTDKITVIDAPTTTFTVTMTTGSGKCGTRDDGSGNADTNFPTTGTYSGIFTLVTDTTSSVMARFPIGHYYQGSTLPANSTKYETVATVQSNTSTPCSLLDANSNTLYFYKVCMNTSTPVRNVNLP